MFRWVLVCEAISMPLPAISLTSAHEQYFFARPSPSCSTRSVMMKNVAGMPYFRCIGSAVV